MKILITESIAEEFVTSLRDQGFEVEEYLGHTQEEIEGHIKGCDALIVRSATKVNENLLKNADVLKVVGRAGTGIDNIDVPACTEHGVIALNTPTANNMAAGELAVAHAFAVFRNLCDANNGVHSGDFRRGNWIGVELEGKTAGVIGLGRIGSIVSRKLKGIGMNVVAYDPYVPSEKFEKLGVTRCETLDDLLPEAYAAVREGARRSLGMEPFRVQLIGGIILHQGRIAEMRTGEGKTLVATLPAYLNALEGRGVHIVTVNDYLAKRDAEWMGQVYRFMGMTVGVVLNSMTPKERQEAYACDITYVTNNELGFDYLRDN
ncbi:MAG: hypothetical protein IKH76_07280, partial [Clostridiales bacterium]|nr:hypothetical protein [Clostridiales bacterium]